MKRASGVKNNMTKLHPKLKRSKRGGVDGIKNFSHLLGKTYGDKR